MARLSERSLLLLLAAVQFTHIMDFMIMMPMGPQLMRELNIGPDYFSALVAAYSISSGVIGMLAAPFIDRFDRRPLVLIAYLGFALSTLTCSLATTAAALLVGRVIAGAFGGISGSLCMTVVGDVIPPERRAAGIGIVMTAFSVAAALGVPVGLQLAQHFGWRAPFILLAVGAAVMWLVALSAFPSVRGHLDQAGDRRKAFLELMKDANAWRALLFMSSMVFGHFTIIPLLSPHLVSNVKLDEHYLFLVYLVGGVLSVVTAPMVGRYADRHGKLRVFSVMVLIASVVILAIVHAPPIPVWAVLILGGLFFIFASGRWVPGQAIITLAVPATRRGAFMSLSSCARDLASGISTEIGGHVVSRGPNGELLHYSVLGWLAVAAALLSIWLAGRVKMADSRIPARDALPETAVETA